MTAGCRLERRRERTERVGDRQRKWNEAERMWEACLCLQAVGLMWPASTLPFTICHIPHYRERNGTAPELRSNRYFSTAPEPRRLSSSSPSHIYISYLRARHLSDTHAEASKRDSEIGSLSSLYSSHPHVFLFFKPLSFLFLLLVFSLFFLPCSPNIVSHLICPPPAQRLLHL